MIHSLSHAPTPLESLVSPQAGVQLFIKRDDLLHPPEDIHFCGNKWRKLKYNLLQAKEAGHTQLLTFGGAYSNHIAAVASAGQLFGFKTIGIIRGEAYPVLNPTLRHATQMAMTLQYWSRSDYREKNSPEALARLRQSFGKFYLLPEGGTNQLALQGVAELVDELHQQLSIDKQTYIALSCGTGGTMAGIIRGLQGQGQVLGFPALKGNFMQDEVRRCLGTEAKDLTNWSMQNTYHFGGYAKHKPELLDFLDFFQVEYGIELDPIYTAKLCFGVLDLLKKGFFSLGSKVVIVHTGGLQGMAGFKESL